MKPLADLIDALLPQTQCGLCGYQGCHPYATAISENLAPINLCPPGGIETLRALGALVGQKTSPLEPKMQELTKPTQRAVIREEECIGCTKCIQACPLDAIVGASKAMHTIIEKDCSGCELCIAPCPVDCIDLISIPEPTREEKTERQSHFRKLYEWHLARTDTVEESETAPALDLSINDRKNAIEAALKRIQSKTKNNEC